MHQTGNFSRWYRYWHLEFGKHISLTVASGKDASGRTDMLSSDFCPLRAGFGNRIACARLRPLAGSAPRRFSGVSGRRSRGLQRARKYRLRGEHLARGQRTVRILTGGRIARAVRGLDQGAGEQQLPIGQCHDLHPGFDRSEIAQMSDQNSNPLFGKTEKCSIV
jgi:hypothetical protein